MHTFAQKPTTTQPTTSAKPSTVGRAYVGRGHDPDSILNLQRTIGNQALLRLQQSNSEVRKVVSTGTASPHFGHDFSRLPVSPHRAGAIQTKLAINMPGDEYEQKADRVAQQVMGMPEPHMQRACPCGGGCLKCQTGQPGKEHEHKQTMRVGPRDSGPTEVPPVAHEILHSPGQPLNPSTRSYFEPRFGHNFSRVRAHSGRQAEQAAQSVNAKALTVSNHIVFGGVRYSPSSREGQQLLAHELPHVIQQLGASGIHAIGSRGHDGLLQRTPAEAEALISRHTSWGNLDETALGQELLRLALGGQLDFAVEVLDTLGSFDRDDVAYEFVVAATDLQLVSLAAAAASRQFLHRLFDELTSGSVADEEQQQADRILQVTARQTVGVSAFEAAATSRRTKIFPFRLPGFTVLNDAPIEARRERGGIWVHSFVRVLGTAEFRAETETLPDEYFLSGIVLPETEVIGVRLYDQGGIIHYTTPLFLIQLANATDQRVLEKILEAAGIGLTLGSGALAGLGVEASMAARVLLWADRATFVLGTVTSVLREHRSWLVEQFGPGFMDAVDIIHSATAIYGLARVALQAPRIIQGLRDSYRAFRAAARSRSSGFSSSEQTTMQQVTQSTDELIDQIDNIQGARRTPQTGPQQAAEPPPLGESAAGRPHAQPAPPTVTEPAPPTVAEPASPRARVDVRRVPTVVRTQNGVDVAIDTNRFQHVLTAHTIENFDPVVRAAEIAGEAPTHLTTFFRRGTVTNPRELYTLIRQALQGAAGRNVVAGANNQILLRLRNHPMEAWVGPAAGGGMRLNSIYPLASTGRNLTAAQIRAYAAEINAGTRTLAQIRAEIARLLQLR